MASLKAVQESLDNFDRMIASMDQTGMLSYFGMDLSEMKILAEFVRKTLAEQGPENSQAL